MPKPHIYFASDHAGFALKNTLIAYARSLGYECDDFGAHALEPDDDYPDYITPCAERVALTPRALGIVIGWSGQGEAMAANRIKGVRAAVFYGGPVDIPTLARHHNNANILSIGAGFVKEEEAKATVKLFLETPFSEEVRHIRRLAKF